MTIRDIRNNKSLRIKFIRYFKEELFSCGEYISSNVSSDFIFNVFERYGYWAGVKYNFWFDEKLEMLEVEERSQVVLRGFIKGNKIK
jgi:hypothetical protein